ncbi:MAG: FAD-dependent monooxygenase [Phaeodactylibacter sp.]|nr:FAD-dependent monooxygenase [Phaeodactylibacter sp.]MCB9275715.1 FAD-dependent monooxygenase [Lewinellaceae bacterium]
MSTKTADFTIIGGGIAGLATAIALHQKGFQAELFEAAPEIRAVGAGISLAPNAALALRKLGLEETIAREGRLLPGMSIRQANGRVITRADGRQIAQRYGAAHYAIHRAALHQALLAKLPGTPMATGKRAIGIRRESGVAVARFEDGSEHEARALILADGIHSPTRQQLMTGSTSRYAGYTCWRAVIEYDGPLIEEATETWGPSGRFGIVPLKGRQVYWFACITSPADNARYKRFTTEDLYAQFQGYHTPIPEIIRQTPDAALLWNDIIDLKPIHQFAFGNIVLTGDAAHATTPNMGQGACQALEDAVVLADEAARCSSPEEAFRQFELRRMERAHYVVKRSWSIGRIAQAQNPLLGALRNALFRLAPSSAAEKPLKYLYEVDF